MTATDDVILGMESTLQRVRERPDSAAAHFNLGLAWTQRGRPARAEACYRRALELDPDLVEAWVNLGGVLLLRWEFAESIAANEEALKRRPDLVLAHYNIGQARLYLGDAQGVVGSYRNVVELDPEHAAGRYYLAVGLLAAGQVPEAVHQLARAKNLGHSPEPAFLRAITTAVEKLIETTDQSTTTDPGADAPVNREES